MATSRSKHSARPRSSAKTARAGKKKAAAARPKAKAKAKPAVKARAAAKPAKAKKPAPPKVSVKTAPAAAAKSAVKAASASKQPPKAVAAKATAGKAALPAKGKAAKVATPPVVRPLGVLPPEARVKVVEKPVAVRPRPAGLVSAPKPATSGVQRVSEKDMKIFEERLLAERQKILKDMGHLENTVLKVNQRDSSGDLSGYSFHMADAGTDAMEREKAFMFASSEGRLLMEVDDALRRLYRGEYGLCEMCGNPIGRARLEAMPHARLCVSCKELEEKANRGKAQAPTPGNS